jgi:hypothetical protein
MMTAASPIDPDRYALGKMKKVTGYFTRGLPYGARLREAVYAAQTTKAACEAVSNYFELLAAHDLRDGFSRVFADPAQPFRDGDSRRLDRPAP